MTPSELKYETRKTSPYFFTRKTMKFFGDSMKNYGVRKVEIDGKKLWELWRKKPVKCGLQNSHYFDRKTFEEELI